MGPAGLARATPRSRSRPSLGCAAYPLSRLNSAISREGRPAQFDVERRINRDRWWGSSSPSGDSTRATDGGAGRVDHPPTETWILVMSKVSTLSEVKAKFSEIVDEVSITHERVTMTSNGRSWSWSAPMIYRHCVIGCVRSRSDDATVGPDGRRPG